MRSWNPFRKQRKQKSLPGSKSPFTRLRYAPDIERFEPRWYPNDMLTVLAVSALGNVAFLFRDRLLALLFPLADRVGLVGPSATLPGLPLTGSVGPPTAGLSLLAVATDSVFAGDYRDELPAEAQPRRAEPNPEWSLASDPLAGLFSDPLFNPWAHAGNRHRPAEVDRGDGSPSTGGGDGAAPAPLSQALGAAASSPEPWHTSSAAAGNLAALLGGPNEPSDPPGEDGGTPPGPAAATRRALPRQPELQRTYGQLPLHFEPNVGQSDAQVQFLARGRGYDQFFTATEVALTLHKPIGEQGRQRGVVRMQMVGANPTARAVGVDRLPGITNYFLGNNPAQWRTNIPNYRKVQFANVYPGVDVVYYGTNQRQLEFDFVVAPGVNPNVIQLAYPGATAPRLDARGHLVLPTLGGDVVQQAPVLYQLVNGRRQRVAGRQVLQGVERVGFEVGAYDASRALYIDPVLSYSSYFGGPVFEEGQGIVVDAVGNAYLTGGDGNAFVVKVNAAGSAQVYATYFGGNERDLGRGIAVDAAGNAYVTGFTQSIDDPDTPEHEGFPTTPNAYQSVGGGGTNCTVNEVFPVKCPDAFMVKLNTSGTLIYSSYLGGNGRDIGDWGAAIAVDVAGNAYITGLTDSTNFPTANALYPSCGGYAPDPPPPTCPRPDAFVARIDPTKAGAASLVYSSYLGGPEWDQGNGIAADADGNAYLIGYTGSTNFPTLNPLPPPPGGRGGTEAFVTKIAYNPLNQTMSLIYSTFLGGNSDDRGNGIALDVDRNVYLTGQVSSTNFPTVNPFQATHRGSTESFVSKLNAAGSALVYSSYLGGSNWDRSRSIAVDASGNAYLTGDTNSTNFPLANPLQPVLAGGGGDPPDCSPCDAFVTKVNAIGSALVYSTYLGGSGDDLGFGIAVDAADNAYVTGYTYSQDFPTASPFQPASGGGYDAFIAKVGVPPLQRLNNPAATWLEVGPGTFASPNNGTLRVVNPLDFRRSPGGAQDNSPGLGVTPALVYNSDTVDVRPISEITARWDPSLGLPANPVLLDFWWNIPDTDPYTSRSSFQINDLAHDPGDTYLLAAQVPPAASVPQSGIYPRTLKATGTFSNPVPNTLVTLTYSDYAVVVRTDSTGATSLDNSSFGAGWSLASLNRLLLVDTPATPDVLMIYGSGDAPRYYKRQLGSNSFTSPPDDFGTLTQSGVTYTYTSKDQVKWEYSSDATLPGHALLRYIRDPHGLAVAFSYGGPPGGPARYLTQIQMPDGGLTLFNYDDLSSPTGALLLEIVEPGNRRVTLSYTDRTLTSIKNPDNQVRSFSYNGLRLSNQQWEPTNAVYAYDAGSGVLDTVDRSLGTLLSLAPQNIFGLTLNPAPLARDQFAYTTDSLGSTNYYDLDGLGRVQQHYRHDQPPDVWLRDHAGQVLVHTDSKGRPTTYIHDYSTSPTYSGKGDLKRIDYPDNFNEQFTYHPTFHYVTERKDKGGGRTTFTYDDLTGDLLTMQDPLHTDTDPRITRYGWSNGLLQTVTNARGFTTSYTWDAAARRLIDVEDALTNRTTYLYAADDSGNVRAIWDAENRRTTFHHDGMRRLVTLLNAAGGLSTYSYNAIGQKTSEENPKGQKTAYDYDGRGWLTVTTEAAHLVFTITNERRSTTQLYDVAGNVTGVQDPRGGLTQFLYDALNRRTVTIDALGKRVTVGYDAADNVIDLRDQLDRQTTFSYDALDRPFETTEAADLPALRRTSTDLYDANSAPSEDDDPCTCGPGGVQRTTYLNDALARQTVSIDPLGQRVTALFDQVGNLTVQIDANDKRTTFLYDALNRQTVTIQPVVIDNANPRITTLYDKVGNITGVKDQFDRLTSYSYDALNRRTAVTEGINSDWVRTTTTLYDAVGNVTGIQTPKVGGAYLTQFNYDALNRKTATIDPLDQTEQIYYDKASNVTGTLDKAGRLTSYAYDALNRVTSTTEAAHLPVSDFNERRTTEQVYDAAGNVTVIVDHYGRRTTFLYDALNRKTVTIQPVLIDGVHPRITTLYDNAGHVTGTQDARGNLTKYFVDTIGRVTGTEDPAPLSGLRQTFYDKAGNVTGTIDPNTNSTSYTYDALHRRTEFIEASHSATLRRITTTLYDAAGNATVVLSPAITGINNRTSYLFDALNRQTVVIDPATRRTTTLRDVAGNVTGVIDPLNRLTSYAYDALNRRTEVTEAALVNNVASLLKRTTVTGYDAVGNVTVVIAPAVGTQNGRTSFLYDALNRQTVVIDPMGFRVTTLYDKLGNVTLVKDKLDHWTSFAYDEVNRKIETTEAAHLPTTNVLRRLTTMLYDAAGNLTVLVSPQVGTENNRTSYLYDALNRKTVTIDQRGFRVTTMHDLAGNVTGIQDPATPNNLTSYLYDALNRRTVTIDRTVTTDPSNPTNQRTTVLYDAHNNVTQITDRNLRIRQFSYDALDRQRQEIWLSGGTPIHTITMDFDAPGRLTQVADPRATYTYGYDDLDRRTSISNAASSGLPPVVLAQGFDARDRRTTLAVTRQGQNDFLNTYTYDPLGRLTSVTQSQQTPGATVAYKRVDLDYNKLDQLLTVTRYGGLATLPNLVVRSEYFAYDDLNRLKGLAHKNPAGTALASYSWDFDKRDRMTAVTYLYGAVTFTYDPTNQVLTASHVYQGAGSGDETYLYDGNGNRTGSFQPGAGNRLTTYQSATVPLTTYTYQYDGEGNRTRRDKKVSGVLTEQVVYQWDHRNRLTYVGLYSGAGLPLTQEVWYTYDAFNRRLAKQVTVITGTTTTQYAYEGDNLAFVFTGAGANATATTRYLTGPAMDQVFADEDVSATPQPRWPLTDQIGTVRELVNNSAQVLKALRYDAFGNIKDDTAPGVQYAFSYTGREFDAETGMYYYRARYYEAVTGKFISEDPKGFEAGDANFYRYVGNHPTYANDPDGLQERTQEIKVPKNTKPQVIWLPDGNVVLRPSTQQVVREDLDSWAVQRNPRVFNQYWVYEEFGPWPGLEEDHIQVARVSVVQNQRNRAWEKWMLPLDLRELSLRGKGPEPPQFVLETRSSQFRPVGGLLSREGLWLHHRENVADERLLGFYDDILSMPLFRTADQIDQGNYGAAALFFGLDVMELGPILAPERGVFGSGPRGKVAGTTTAEVSSIPVESSGQIVLRDASGRRILVAPSRGGLAASASGDEVFDAIMTVPEHYAPGSGRQPITDPSRLLEYKPGAYNVPPNNRTGQRLLPGMEDAYDPLPVAASQFTVGQHGTMPSPRPGQQSHHGAMSAWMRSKYSHYDPDLAPAVLMPEASHHATFGVYNTWRANLRQRMGGTFDWSKVGEAEMRSLSESMFDAAQVPVSVRQQYWAEYQRMLQALQRQASKGSSGG